MTDKKECGDLLYGGDPSIVREVQEATDKALKRGACATCTAVMLILVANDLMRYAGSTDEEFILKTQAAVAARARLRARIEKTLH